jgi:TatA/E family protein of Tat protein translocase
MWMPGGSEWIVILAVGLLLFGKRLPEIARSLGKGVVEFKKGLREVEDDLNRTPTSTSSYSGSSYSDSSSSYSRDTSTPGNGESYGQTGEQASASVSGATDAQTTDSPAGVQTQTESGKD